MCGIIQFVSNAIVICMLIFMLPFLLKVGMYWQKHGEVNLASLVTSNGFWNVDANHFIIGAGFVAALYMLVALIKTVLCSALRGAMRAVCFCGSHKKRRNRSTDMKNRKSNRQADSDSSDDSSDLESS